MKRPSLIIDIHGTIFDVVRREYEGLKLLYGDSITYEMVKATALDYIIAGKSPYGFPALDGQRREELFKALGENCMYAHDSVILETVEPMTRISELFIIFYVTNAVRNEESEKLMKNLLKDGKLPYPDGSDVFLVMKPSRDLKARAFKRQEIRRIKEVFGAKAGIGDAPWDAESAISEGLAGWNFDTGRFKKDDYPTSTIHFEQWRPLPELLERRYTPSSIFVD